MKLKTKQYRSVNSIFYFIAVILLCIRDNNQIQLSTIIVGFHIKFSTRFATFVLKITIVMYIAFNIDLKMSRVSKNLCSPQWLNG